MLIFSYGFVTFSTKEEAKYILEMVSEWLI